MSRKNLLKFLWMDLVLSIAFLLVAFYVSRGRELPARPEYVVKEEAPKEGLKEEPTEEANQRELIQVRQEVTDARQNVEKELNQQQEKISDVLAQEKQITLAELEQISPEAYRQCMRQWEHERSRAKRQLESRRHFLEEMKTGILPEDEDRELREFLEFLIQCDEDFSEGRPIPDRSAEYDWPRQKRLREIAQKYCMAVTGCSEATMEKDRLRDQAWSGYRPTIIVPMTPQMRIRLSGNQ